MCTFHQIRRWFVACLAGVCLLSGSSVIHAQDATPPAPQFLLHTDDVLVLINGYTGERTVVREGVTETAIFRWMPDGRSVLALSAFENCLTLMAIESDGLNQSIARHVSNTLISTDGSGIYYTTVSEDGNNETLWRYNTSGTYESMYRTTEGTANNPSFITFLDWSPTRAYLEFQDAHQSSGRALNVLVVLNLTTRQAIHISGQNPYFAFYEPIWSADDRWILVRLLDDYADSTVYPVTNDRGDVYLFNADNGDRYRLTYTPTVSEVDIHWTDAGEIAFTEVINHSVSYTLDQAMNIPAVPEEDIVTPAAVESISSGYATDGNNLYPSPDPRVTAVLVADQIHTPVLRFHREVTSPDEDIVVGEIYNTSDLIGWQPTDYSYP